MNPGQKAFTAIWEHVQFMKRTRSPELHLKAHEEAAKLRVPVQAMQNALMWCSSLAGMTLTTWSNRAWREVSYQECPVGFFSNRDDGNHVRLRLRSVF